MKIPNIVFEYSWIYDRNFEEFDKLVKNHNEKYPSYIKILNYIEKVKILWKKHEEEILKELSRVSKLKWKKQEISCYVVGRTRPFSIPLTLPIYPDCPDYFIDVLVHELIHNLFMQEGNFDKAKKSWGYIYRKFKDESLTTKIHIPLHALHMHIYLKFFDKTRLERDFDWIKFIPDYKKSWELVRNVGYEKIIEEFTKRIL